MSKEKLRVEEILRRIDDLLDILKILSEDLTEVSKTLRATVGSLTLETQEAPSFEQMRAAGQMRTVEDVQRLFPQDLAGMLYFEVTEDYVLIKPRQYLGSENFAKIASIVRDQLNGEYVSAGRESHFRVPRKF